MSGPFQRYRYPYPHSGSWYAGVLCSPFAQSYPPRTKPASDAAITITAYTHMLPSGTVPIRCLHKNSLNCRWIVAFRPELLEEVPPLKRISPTNTSFSYRPQEALHLSVAETNGIEYICIELRRPGAFLTLSTVLTVFACRKPVYATCLNKKQVISATITSRSNASK